MYVVTVYNVQIQILVQIQIRRCMCSYPYDQKEEGRGFLLQLIPDLLLQQLRESIFLKKRGMLFSALCQPMGLQTSAAAFSSHLAGETFVSKPQKVVPSLELELVMLTSGTVARPLCLRSTFLASVVEGVIFA